MDKLLTSFLSSETMFENETPKLATMRFCNQGDLALCLSDAAVWMKVTGLFPSTIKNGVDRHGYPCIELFFDPPIDDNESEALRNELVEQADAMRRVLKTSS